MLKLWHVKLHAKKLNQEVTARHVTDSSIGKDRMMNFAIERYNSSGFANVLSVELAQDNIMEVNLETQVVSTLDDWSLAMLQPAPPKDPNDKMIL